MNKLTTATVFSAALMFAGLAMAQDAAPAKTRAEVIAELQQARESGELARMHSEKGLEGFLVTPQRATAFAVKPAVNKTAAPKS